LGGQPTTHAFTHAYFCPAEDAENAHCIYQPRLVVTDNWNWCSGSDQQTKTSGQVKRYDPNAESSGSDLSADVIANCGTADKPNFAIWVNQE
jgi:hypothetical protein